MPEAKGVWTTDGVALVLIDYQKEMFENVKSETKPDEIELNVRFLIRAARAFNIPVILSSVGAQMGVNGPTLTAIRDDLPGIEVIDRSSMDAWEDKAFRAAINKTGKKRLIFAALYTEICLAFPVIDAMRDGYDAMFVVDAVGGMSQLAHRTAIERLTAAGAAPNTSLALVTELFRDWRSPIADKAREVIKWHYSRDGRPQCMEATAIPGAGSGAGSKCCRPAAPEPSLLS
jgi:nicotinamidase-related amidase